MHKVSQPIFLWENLHEMSELFSSDNLHELSEPIFLRRQNA